MSQTMSTLPTETVSTEITRFNALRHGVLSRYTVLPWENADEYNALAASLASEHDPQGPTEEHLVEELAGILWRKRVCAWPRPLPPARALEIAWVAPRYGAGGAGTHRR
jgi:hypothetical protein